MKYYDITKLTIQDVEEMLSNGDDEHHNQVRVTKDGKVFLSQDVVGYMDTDDLAFRYETFAAHNNYVGRSIRKSLKSEGTRIFILDLYNSLKRNWEAYTSGCLANHYIDSF